jgi:hypothetical protein
MQNHVVSSSVLQHTPPYIQACAGKEIQNKQWKCGIEV